MKKLNEVMFNPSGWDSKANYAGEEFGDEWLAVYAHHRDSELLTESNWYTALRELGGESEDVQIFRFGHWAVGWIEYLVVRAGSDQEKIGEDITERLNDYPILDESDYSERETEEANRIWKECYNSDERLAYIRENRSQFEFYDYRDLIGCVRGKYFSGYASELIN